MGYTHYWTPKPLDEKAFEAAAQAIKSIIGLADVKICGWDGTGEPEYGPDRVAFNGSGAREEDCETFIIRPNDPEWTFCKTRGYPYDNVVTAALTYLAAEHGFEIGSDGGPGDWEAGNKLATLALGKAYPNPRKEDEDA